VANLLVATSSVRLSVPLSVCLIPVLCLNHIVTLFDVLAAASFFQPYRRYKIPTGTPLARALNALGVGEKFAIFDRNRHSSWDIGPWLLAPCGLRGCKNLPAPFPGRMSFKATKPGLVSVVYLSIHYMVSLFIRAPFYVLLVFNAMCAVFWLFWLSYQYLPSDWLERLVCVPPFFCVSLGS